MICVIFFTQESSPCGGGAAAIYYQTCLDQVCGIEIKLLRS